jgi:hypothetical protein
MDKKTREISLEDLKNYDYYCTVGKLLEFIKSKLDSGELTKDSLVLSQRIEDFYFEKNGWGVVKKEGEHYHWSLEHNKKIDEGVYLDKEQYPLIKEDSPILKKITEEEMEDSKDEYHPIWCPVVYTDDKNLYLDLHY